MSRRRFEWRFAKRRISLGERTLVAGTVHVAPEQQPGGHDPLDPDRAFALAIEMEEAGADLLLVSAEALIAGAKRIADVEEVRRLTPVLKRLRDKVTTLVGVVTDKSAVAERAFELGAEVIFDQSGLAQDPQLAKVILKYDGGLIVSQMRGTPEAWAKLPPITNPIPGLLQDLDASLGRARRSGINPYSLIADTGIGFGKRREQCVETFAEVSALDRLDVPISTGIGDLPDAATSAVAATRGCHIVRTTEVKAVRAALDFTDAVLAAAAARAELRADNGDSSASRAARRRP